MALLLRFSILVFILSVAGCGLGKQAQLDSYVESEKQQLPKVLFANVRVVDIESAESEIVYYCDVKADAGAAMKAKNRLLANAGDYVKDNKTGLKRLIDAKIKMTFVVKQASGDELFRVSINPWEL